MWHVTCDPWHVTCHTWHVTCHTWHVTCDNWLLTHIFKKKNFQKVKKSTKNSTTTKMAKTCPKVQKSVKKAGFHIIGATICTCWESWCLPYAGFFLSKVKALYRSSMKAYLYVHIYKNKKKCTKILKNHHNLFC